MNFLNIIPMSPDLNYLKTFHQLELLKLQFLSLLIFRELY